MMRLASWGLLGWILLATQPAGAADLLLLTTGAYLPVASALAPLFEARTHQHVTMVNDTVGAVLAQARGGAAFDVIILTPPTIGELITAGIVQPGSSANLAEVGVGVVVKTGAPMPDISSVAAFKQTLLNAKSVAYIDPASGGSSGIVVAHLLQRLGIAAQIGAHAVLVPGGRVADHIARGEAELGLHQISEILPVAGVTLVGPLPADIQSETIYTGGISRTTSQPDAARRFLSLLAGPDAGPVLAQKGMQPVPATANH